MVSTNDKQGQEMSKSTKAFIRRSDISVQSSSPPPCRDTGGRSCSDRDVSGKFGRPESRRMLECNWADLAESFGEGATHGSFFVLLLWEVLELYVQVITIVINGG